MPIFIFQASCAGNRGSPSVTRLPLSAGVSTWRRRHGVCPSPSSSTEARHPGRRQGPCGGPATVYGLWGRHCQSRPRHLVSLWPTRLRLCRLPLGGGSASPWRPADRCPYPPGLCNLLPYLRSTFWLYFQDHLYRSWFPRDRSHISFIRGTHNSACSAYLVPAPAAWL